jgi:N-methylhydantoinase A/oxoprolinase/acetone carboxylase beta subunit
MSGEDEWYDSDDTDDTFDRLSGLLPNDDKTPVERLQEQVKEHEAATERAYERIKAANAEFQHQQQLLDSKQRELAAAQQAAAQQAAAQQAAANKPKSSIEQYMIALRKSRQGMSFNQWQQDASKNKERHRLYKMYTQLIKDKLANPMNMPTFGKYPGEK